MGSDFPPAVQRVLARTGEALLLADVRRNLWILAGVWLAWRLIRSLYVAHFGPLARANLPGPYLNRWSSLPYLSAALSGRAMYYLDDLMAQYGPMVRIAPDEVAVGDPALARTIHAVGSGYLKAPFYARLADERPPIWRDPVRYLRAALPQPLVRALHIDAKPPSAVNLVATNDLALHGARRRLYARPFSKQGILHWEGVLKRKTALWVEGMRNEALQPGSEGRADVFKWLALLTSDTIAELCFGQTFGGLAAGRVGPYMQDLQRALIVGGVMAFLPSLGSILVNLPIPPLRRILSTGIRLRAVGRQMMADYLVRERQGQGTGTIFDKAMEATVGAAEKAGEGAPLPVEGPESVELREQDARTLLVGGTDTTTTTLTYILWLLTGRPSERDRLLAELDEQGIDPRDIEALDLGKLREMPYLNAVIQEGLRLYGAGSGNLPRSVPAGGKVLGGYALPEGTVVNPQAYTQHRIPSVFPEPHSFKPERWLRPTPEMQQAFLAWSHGARVCLGLHLARDEMLLGTVAFLGAFPHATIPPETTDKSMEMEHYFAVAPRGHKCLIHLGVKA